MALSFRPGRLVDRDVIAAAWLAVIDRHDTLRTVFSPGEHGPELHEVTVEAGGWVEHPIAAGQAVNDALRDVLDIACSPYAEPSHRLCILETAAGPTVVVAADHSHVDMWSMLVIARDLLAAIGQVEAGRTPMLPPAAAFVDHTRALNAWPTAPDDVHRRWREVLTAGGGALPTFPLSLGPGGSQPERVEVRDVLDVDDTQAFTAQARADDVSTLSLAVSAMTAVTRELADAPLRAVFPVHSRHETAWHDSVGWFITNSVLESDRPSPEAAAAAVREAVRLGSWPLRAILADWGGELGESPGMFAISWLDLRRLPVRIDARSIAAQYVGATIRTDGVMVWFILNDGGMHVRCRYPDTLEARANVGGWLDALVHLMRQIASSSVGRTVTVDDRSYRITRAKRTDVPAIVRLLADDEVTPDRETADLARYEAAYDDVLRHDSYYLAVVRDAGENVVATMQLNVIGGLKLNGTVRLEIEAFRVAASERSRGLGSAMLDWAHEHGRAHGASLVQVTADEIRNRARSFYTGRGYRADHVGLTRSL